MDEVRRIRKDEKNLASQISSIAFNFHYEEPDEKKLPELFAWPAEWTWGYFSGGKMVSCITDIPYAMRFDGHNTGMTGIGGVASLPETRHGGKIRKIFESLLREEYENGTEFSSLNPFSHSFYRMFGYELCNDRNEVTIQSSVFKKLKPSGRFEQHFPGDPTDILQKIHEQYIADINQTILRNHWDDDLAWKMFTHSSPYKDDIFTYIWHDEKDNPRSYISFRREMQDGGAVLFIREIVFTDGEALQNALAFFSLLSFREFRWEAPTFIPIADLFPENWDFTQKLIPRDMLRVIHVQRALEKMRTPKNLGAPGSLSEGEYILEINDPMLPENCGKFRVEFDSKGSRVSKTDKAPDLSCDIPSLSQLVIGYRTLDNMLLCRKGIELHKNKELLSDVFTYRPSHLSENF